MRIAILHGYELTGSGSNEYSRYLSRALAEAGHEVHVLCREPAPERIEHLRRAFRWDVDGRATELFRRERPGNCVLHQLPHAAVRPVYLTDKQRVGRVKSFVQLSDDELDQFHRVSVAAVRAVLRAHPVDLLHANHLVWQPSVAAAVGVPFVIFPHGSSIEYTVRRDARYHAAARAALLAARGLISGSREVLARIFGLFAEDAEVLRARSSIVGVGVDTDLFTPRARADRPASIARLAGGHGSESDGFRGKTAALRGELEARLARGDWQALSGYHESYDHSVPDVDMHARLAALPWTSGKVLLFVGALTAGKGLQALIAALPRVLEQHPDAHLVVVGSGAYREVLEGLVIAIARGDQPLFEYLCSHGFDLDRSDLSGGWRDIVGAVPQCARLAAHVHFVGRLEHGLLSHLFPCADLAVFPSVVPEAYPLVLMEALSNGLLPVVSDFSGFADGLDELERFLEPELVARLRLPVEPEGRVAGIAARLCSLLADPELPARSTQLRQIAVEHFDWRIRAEQIAAAYQSYAGGGTGGRATGP